MRTRRGGDGGLLILALGYRFNSVKKFCTFHSARERECDEKTIASA